MAVPVAAVKRRAGTIAREAYGVVVVDLTDVEEEEVLRYGTRAWETGDTIVLAQRG
jgi:hypothetical protein